MLTRLAAEFHINDQQFNRHTDRWRVQRIAWLPLCLLGVLLASCGGIDVSSTFRNREIVVDADAKDWSGLPLYTKDKISFAVCNDANHLFILMTTSDRTLQRQLAATGVNVWFNSNGGSEKVLGIHYPLRGPGAFGRQQRAKQGEPPENPDDSMDPAEGMQGKPPDMRNNPGEGPLVLEMNSHELEILGPDGDREIVTLAEAKDLQLKMSASSGLLVFELRVPLVRDLTHPHGIGASIANAIGVGVETPKFDMPGRGEGRMQPSGGEDGDGPGMGGGMPPGGGMGGGRGSPGGGGPHGGGGGQRPSTESISLWAKVTLAGK